MKIKHNYEVGDTARIEVVFKQNQPFQDDEVIIDPDSMKITITEEYDGTEVVSDQDMTKYEDGKYYYLWDTTGEDAGDYEIKITGTDGGNTDVEDEYVRLE